MSAVRSVREAQLTGRSYACFRPRTAHRTTQFGRLFSLLQTNYLNLLVMADNPDDVWVLLSLMAMHSDATQRFTLLAEVRYAGKARCTGQDACDTVHSRPSVCIEIAGRLIS